MATIGRVHDLNDLLRGEILACEGYKQALKKMKDPDVRKVLENNLACHTRRVQILQDEVEKGCCEPFKSSSIIGAAVNCFRGVARLFGDRAMLSALVEGEDRGSVEYINFKERYGDNCCAALSELLTRQERSDTASRSLMKHA